VPAATVATFVLSVVVALPFAVIWWDAQASVWPYALASTVLETIYVVGLAYAYRTADVSFVYPLTRGLAPVLTLAFVVVAFAHRPSAAEVSGVLLVGVGVVLVRGLGAGGLHGHGDARSLVLVLTIAAATAAYTLVDRAGIHHAGALTYYVLVLVGPCLVAPAFARWNAMRRELGPATVAAALASLVSFLLGLLALRQAAAAPVLAVRSSSVVFATLLAGRFLAEDVSHTRVVGSLLVFGGVALLAL
jgi:drug/metabolite transporter (DMT)-like permease